MGSNLMEISFEAARFLEISFGPNLTERILAVDHDLSEDNVPFVLVSTEGDPSYVQERLPNSVRVAQQDVAIIVKEFKPTQEMN